MCKLMNYSNKSNSSNLYIKISTLFLIFLFILQVNSLASVAPSFTTSSMFRSGTWAAVSTLKSQADTFPNYAITYSSSLVSGRDKINAITSVSSFDCLASTQFSFNTTLSAITLTGFNVLFQIFGNTYLNKIKFDYLAMTWTSGIAAADVLYNDCFLTSDLAVVTTTRSQKFVKQNFTNLVVDGTLQKIQSFITGLKFFNNKDVSKKISINSYIANGTNYITQQISVTGNTVLQWVCMGTAVIESTYSYFYQQVLPYKLGAISLNRLSASIDMTTFPTGYLTKYQYQDNKFFGLIQLQMYLGKPYQIINFKSQNPATVQLGYESLAAGGKIGFFFFSSRICPPSNAKYSLIDNKCWDTGCPDGQVIATGNICIACHFSCLKCNGITSIDCQDCDPANKRGPVAANTCPCSTGFVQNNVALCPPCSNFIPNCVQCTSKSVCTTCTSTMFVFNPVTVACQCPAGFYYVVASNLCAPYPGCLIAQNNTNSIYCLDCDSAQHFYLDNVTKTCKCNQYFTQSGSTCVDLCGDGVNPLINSTTYCDDGNPTNGDGCSTTCAVETNFGCFNPPNILKSVCSPVKTFSLKFMYAQRVVNENAGYFLFDVSPVDYQLADPGFTYYVESDIPHTTAIGTYDPLTSILKIKVSYTETIQDQNHDIKITLDPYKMSVTKASFSLKSSGVNYDLSMDDSPKMNTYLWYFTISVSGLIVITSLIINFINYKIAATQLLLSSQLVYLSLLAWMSNNVSLWPLTGLKYLAGYNTLKQFDINKYNANTPFLLSSYTFAEFLLNFNIMAGVIVLVIFIIIPLKINVWFRMYQRTRFTSPQMQQKLIHSQPTTSLSQLSAKIKTVQYIADTYVDRVYFGFSLIVFLPIVLYFSIQLGFIGKVGRYELSSFANIMLSILLLMLDFCFFILVFQDTDKKLKMFNFGSKKLKSYPNRLMMFYFGTCCLFTIVLLSQFTYYVLLGMTLITGIYIVVENPYQKLSLQYIDSISKPIIALICQLTIKATSFFNKQIIFIPIIVDSLLLISCIITIVRVIRIKLNRAQAAKKMLEDAQMDDQGQIDFQKNMKNTDQSQFNSQKNKKMNAKFTEQNQQQLPIQKPVQNNQNDDSTGELNKDQSPYHQADQIGDQDQDQLTRIKRSLREDLKKRRGIVQKANDDGNVIKPKKSKKKSRVTVDFQQDNSKND